MNAPIADKGCIDCGGVLLKPSRGRRIRCFACTKKLLAKPKKQKFEFSIFSEDWNAGMNVDELSEKYGVSTNTIYGAARAANAKRKRTWTREDASQANAIERGEQMKSSYLSGLTLEQIGQIHGVTRERVRQILAKHGVKGQHSGRTKAIAERRAIKAMNAKANRDQRCIESYGCTYQAIESLFGVGVILTKTKATLAYAQHKKNAIQREVEFSITFLQWWSVWQKSGKWNERGRGKYVMARNGDVGAYAVGNVHICTSSENVKEGYIKTPGHVRAAKAQLTRAGKPHVRLGSGRGYTILKKCKKRPYQVMCGKDKVGYFATEEEARSAYLAACEEKRRKAEAVLAEAA